jgi:hypothetical protein
MQPVDREGVFRGVIAEYGTKEFTGGTIAIKFRAELTELYDGEQWHPWTDYQQEVYGDSFVVKKDGSINEAAVNSLVNHAGWDGTFASVNDATWKPTPCQFKVVSEEYKGKTYYKVDFINGFDDVPGGGGLPKIDGQKAKGLDARFGSQLRAIAANKMRNQSAPPAGAKPPAPPKPAAKEHARDLAAAQDSIPF